MMAVTIKDIAREVNVNSSTVSVALSDRVSGDRRISPGRIKQIREVAERMGYRPNLSARNLRSGRALAIGVVMAYLNEHPLADYFFRIRDLCASRGYHVIPLPVQCSDAANARQLSELESCHVDGLILMHYHAASYGQYERLWKQGHAMVFRVLEKVKEDFCLPHVMIDHAEGNARLVKHVADRGWQYLVGMAVDYKDEGIGLVSPVPGATAYFHELIFSESLGARHRYDATKHFFDRHSLRPGTCLIQDNAEGISGTYAALQELGYCVGKDVALAVVHQPRDNELVVPSPTYVAEPYEEVAEKLTELLFDQLEAKDLAAKRGLAGVSQKQYVVFTQRIAETESVPCRKGIL